MIPLSAIFSKRYRNRWGKAKWAGVMDRGVPTEEVLWEIREAPVYYLVGTPKGKLSRCERAFTELPLYNIKDGVGVKLLSEGKKAYVLAQSRDRIHKERGIRRRQLKKPCKRLHELHNTGSTRDQLLLKLGAARQRSPSTQRFIQIVVPKEDTPFM